MIAFRILTPQQVLVTVMHVAGVTRSELAGHERAPRISRARWMYAALCTRYTSHSFPEIGLVIGKPHSSIIAYLAHHDRQINNDEYNALFSQCHRLLGSPRPVVRRPSANRLAGVMT